LGINSYFCLVKNAPDLDSKQNQLREWKVETIRFRLEALLESGEWNRINRFLNLLAIWGKGKGGVSSGGVASGDWEVGTRGKGGVLSQHRQQLF